MSWLIKQEGTGHAVGDTVEIDDEVLWRSWRRAGLIEFVDPASEKKPRRRRTTQEAAD